MFSGNLKRRRPDAFHKTAVRQGNRSEKVKIVPLEVIAQCCGRKLLQGMGVPEGKELFSRSLSFPINAMN